MKRLFTLSLLVLSAAAALAKLPVPVLSDDAKAKAAEAAAKTAHGNKVADFQLCRSMDNVAVKYQADAKKAGKDVKPPTATPPCADPGAFVYPPPAATATAPAAAAPAAPAAPVPAAAKAPAKKG
jgi:phage protein D